MLPHWYFSDAPGILFLLSVIVLRKHIFDFTSVLNGMLVMLMELYYFYPSWFRRNPLCYFILLRCFLVFSDAPRVVSVISSGSAETLFVSFYFACAGIFHIPVENIRFFCPCLCRNGLSVIVFLCVLMFSDDHNCIIFDWSRNCNLFCCSWNLFVLGERYLLSPHHLPPPHTHTSRLLTVCFSPFFGGGGVFWIFFLKVGDIIFVFFMI